MSRSPEEKARREKIRELLQMANIDSMDDVPELVQGTPDWTYMADYMRLELKTAEADFGAMRLYRAK